MLTLLLPGPFVTINAFSYNECHVYIDEEWVGDTHAVSLVRQRSDYPILLTVACKDSEFDNVHGGLLVSLSNRFTTASDSWKQQSYLSADWSSISYSDNNWDNPHQIGRNNDLPNGWPKQADFDDNAQWIWSQNSSNAMWTLFRGTLGED